MVIKCYFEGCENIVTQIRKDILYCQFHICKFPGCREKIEVNSMGCKDHKCQVLQCPDIIERNAYGQHKYCSQHLCQIFWCNSSTLVGGKYCERHSCTTDGCLEFHRCSRHLCHTVGCCFLKSEDSNYCEKHRCQIPSCREEIKLIPNPRDRVYRYPEYLESLKHRCKQDCDCVWIGPKYLKCGTCIKHTCHQDSCSNSLTGLCEVEGGGGERYCDDHRCQEPNCQRLTKINRKFCGIHRGQLSPKTPWQ